ncbi:MAG: DJ-1/PfpI family protein [Candidatus Bathyarchaeota archaeon]|nr:MAG: DJ-1/PfpI family protein [Candidatus Bathyarchaeota archaeon]
MKKLYVSICLLIVVAGVVTGAYFYLRPEESRLEGFRILAIIADGFDYGELYGVNKTLAEEGIIMTTASFTTDGISGHGSYPRNYEPDIAFDEVNVSLYDVIFIPGGDGPENIINHPDGQKVFDILTQAHSEGKIIAAICHGPWVLAAANIVDGKNVTCYNDADMVTDLLDSGANVDTSRYVVRDGNLITAIGPGVLNAFTEKILSVLIEERD